MRRLRLFLVIVRYMSSIPGFSVIRESSQRSSMISSHSEACIGTQHDVGSQFVYVGMDENLKAINSRNSSFAFLLLFTNFFSITTSS